MRAHAENHTANHLTESFYGASVDLNTVLYKYDDSGRAYYYYTVTE